MQNPFNFLQLATGEQFYDRAGMKRDILSRLMSGPSNIVLYGPRRYGKSSLVHEIAIELEKAGIATIAIDVVKLPSIDLFTAAYATKVYRKLAPARYELRKLMAVFKNIQPKLTFSTNGETALSFEPAKGEISSEELTEILDLPQKLLSGKRRAVVIMDEFQEVEGLLPNDRFERVMRSTIQTHRNVSYIFLGSRYHMLRRMFTDHNRPFYKSAVTMLLGKPPREESAAFVAARFASAGKTISSEAADALVAKIENIPYCIQQLGFETFRIVDDAGRDAATIDDVEAAFGNLANFNSDQHEQLMLTLSTAQKKLLIALAKERTAEFGEDYRRRNSPGVSSTVNSTKTKLLEDGHIEFSDGVYTIADPFFGQYLR